MWITNIKPYQFEFIAKTMRDNGRGYEWHTGDYTAIKLTMEDWKKYFPHYLPKNPNPVMKYQHILNGKLLFGTNDVFEFILYLIQNKDAEQAKNAILCNLLEKSNGYVCDMSSVPDLI